jgi:single-strand DNA-binding protein
MQMNRIELAGYLGGDPQCRYLGSGTKVATVRLAESYRFTTRDQQEQEHTNWHNLVFYGPLADFAEGFKKGDNVFVEGTMQVRQYTPVNGHRRTHYEVIARTTHLIAKSPAVKETPGANAPNTRHATTLNDPPVGVEDSVEAEDFYKGRT